MGFGQGPVVSPCFTDVSLVSWGHQRGHTGSHALKRNWESWLMCLATDHETFLESYVALQVFSWPETGNVFHFGFPVSSLNFWIQKEQTFIQVEEVFKTSPNARIGTLLQYAAVTLVEKRFTYSMYCTGNRSHFILTHRTVIAVCKPFPCLLHMLDIRHTHFVFKQESKPPI